MVWSTSCRCWGRRADPSSQLVLRPCPTKYCNCPSALDAVPMLTCRRSNTQSPFSGCCMEELTAINARYIGRSSLLAAVLVLAGSADVALAQAGSDEYLRQQKQVRDDSRRVLENFLRTEPDPFQCKLGFQLGPKQFIVALSRRAEQEGLRRGDLIKTIDGLSVADSQERSRVNAALSAARPVDVVLERKGQTIRVSLPCIPAAEVWAETKRSLEAAVGGAWDDCQSAALEIARFRGYITSLPLELRMRCAAVQWSGQRNRDTAFRFARATYEWQQARIRERSYEPGGIDDIRSNVVSDVTVLRREGFT